MKVDQMFPRKYATGADLGGQAVTVIIASMQPEQMRPNRNARPETKYVIYFEGATKGVVLNRTLANQIAQITGEQDTDNWIGHRITLYPVPMKVAGQDRIAIRARAPKPDNGQSPPATLQEDD